MRGVAKFLLLALCLFVANASARTVGEQLSGYFKIMNYSVWSNNQWVPKYSNNPKGTINYVPAFPGAKYGNMSVCFGEDTQGPEPFTPAQVLDGMVAYTGPYEIEEEEERVAHRIIIITNPYSALTKVGNPNYRWYSFFENDNILRLFVEKGADLYWERINKFPTCDVAAQVSARSGSSWASEGVTHSVFDVSVKNNGASTVSSVRVRIQGAISQSWGLTPVEDNLYSVDLYSTLASGGSVTPGFIASGTVSVTVVESSC